MKGIVFIDEAGEKGLVRNVQTHRDALIGLMCGLLVLEESECLLRSAFKPHFDKFCAAAPEGAKIHITDTFLPGNEAWAEVACEVRAEGLSLLEQGNYTIIYDARRLNVVRESYEIIEQSVEAASQNRCSNVRIPERSDSERVDEQLVQGLILKLDAYAQDHNLDSIDLRFDEIDTSLRKNYEGVLRETQSIEATRRQVKGWNLEEKKRIQGEIAIQIKAPFSLDVKHIGNLDVAGKKDSLVLLADIVTNGLYHHLCSLGPKDPLNAPSSIAEWHMCSRVWGVRDNAVEDCI